MNRLVEGLRVMFGAAPRRPPPGSYTVRAREIHANKKLTKADFQRARDAEGKYRAKKRWLKIRWATLIAVNLLFGLSYWVDVQVVEGSLSGSRVLGLHMVDLNAALQVMLAHKHIIMNLLIGTATAGLVWALLGGRSFCAWVCPYHLLSELAEKLHLRLAAKKLVKDHQMPRALRVVLWGVFAALAYATGYTVFESISPTGVVSRALIYGPGLALLWIGALLAFEVLYSRRAWCRYLCPIGLTYGVVGTFAPVKVTYKLANCLHEGECLKVCLVPHVLDLTIKGRAEAEHLDVGADCTRCGMCIDVCPSGALTFKIAGITRHR